MKSLEEAEQLLAHLREENLKLGKENEELKE